MRKVGFFDIYVDDMARAQKFYETVLDTKFSKMDDPNDSSVQMQVFKDDLQSHGTGSALVKVKGAKPGLGEQWFIFPVKTVLSKRLVLKKMEARS